LAAKIKASVAEALKSHFFPTEIHYNESTGEVEEVLSNEFGEFY